MCHAGIIGSALRPGDAPGAVPGVVPHRTRGSVRTGAPGAGIGIGDGRGHAAGTREDLAHGTGSVKGMTSAPVKASKSACPLNIDVLPLQLVTLLMSLMDFTMLKVFCLLNAFWLAGAGVCKFVVVLMIGGFLLQPVPQQKAKVIL